MGQQLGMSESFTIVVDAIKATGENFDRVFYHDHLMPESLGFSVTIVDINLAKEISKGSAAICQKHQKSDADTGR